MDRIVDIATDGLHLGIYRGFLTVAKDKEEVGRIALDDIGALIAHAHGLTWSHNVFIRLAENKVPVVLCAQNHAPIAIIWPLEGHYHQAKRMQAQAEAPLPLKKQLWKQIITAKVTMQARLIEALDKTTKSQSHKSLTMLARRVRSGDSQNIEAQAARKYWPLLFGSDFRRDRNGDSTNSLLNYGYTILRSIVSRALCASGLHPTLGLFHSNNYNAFALADDMMEPFRPYVDAIVHNLIKVGKTEINTETKQILTSLSTFDLEGIEGVSPLFIHINRFTHSLATSFDTGQAKLVFPLMPSNSELRRLGCEGTEAAALPEHNDRDGAFALPATGTIME